MDTPTLASFAAPQGGSASLGAARLEAGGVTEITLAHPIDFGGEKIGKLVLRRPTARDFRPLKSMEFPFAMMLDFAASLASLPAAALDSLDVDDVPRVLEAVGGFLGGFPGTGKT